MGGEPLLHPTPDAFINITREIFPLADLRVVTNGLLLKKASVAFWEACRKAQVTLNIAVYAVLESSAHDVLEFCARQKVRVEARHKNTFYAQINPHGDSDPIRSFDFCRSLYYCPFLFNSRLYVCALPPTVQYYNEKFGRSIPGDPGIDFYDPQLDGQQILSCLRPQ